MGIKEKLRKDEYEAHSRLHMSRLIESCQIDRTETCFLGKGNNTNKDLNPMAGKEYLRHW